MNTETKSEYRRMRPDEVASLVKLAREHLTWKQQTLADEAGVTLRTVQRVESGSHQADDTTLRIIAKALKLDSEVFVSVSEFKSPEALLKDMEDWKKKHDMLRLEPADSGQALMTFVETINAWSFHHDEPDNDDERAAIGTLLDYVRDLLDTLDDLYPSQKLESAKNMDEYLEELRSFGLKAFVASRKTALLGKNWENKTPMPITVGYLLLSKDHKEMIIVPKNTQVRFGA